MLPHAAFHFTAVGIFSLEVRRTWASKKHHEDSEDRCMSGCAWCRSVCHNQFKICKLSERSFRIAMSFLVFSFKMISKQFLPLNCVASHLLLPSIPAFSARPDRCKMDKNGTAEMQRCSRCSCDATNLEGFLDGEPRHVTAEVFDVSAVSLVNLGCKSPTLSWWPREKKTMDMDRFQKKKTWLFSMTFAVVDADRRQRLRVGPFLRCRAPPPWLNNFCQPKKCTQHMSPINSAA